jgi:ubiquinone/menaquinone biosynthesis C-methylase UbiE
MRNPLDLILVREPHVCPWWCCFTFDNPLRKLIHKPVAILSPYVRQGFTVVDIGPGMGYFTVELCRLVGEEGRVIALDVQEKMLDATRKRAQRAGVAERLETRLVGQNSLQVTERADFVLAFWMVHEVPDQGQFLDGVLELLKPGARFLLVEPYLHVSAKGFAKTVQKAVEAGLVAEETPRIAYSRSTLFSRPLKASER